MKLKVCGMNHNTEAVAALLPDYLGFIFWTPSSRAFTGTMPVLPKTIKKVGVFVDAPLETVQEKVQQYGLDAVQLHGQESPEYCQALLHNLKGYGNPELIKVFSIKGNDFDFSTLSAYETVCDYYLFDTKGALPGGNGYTFDWTILEEYPSTKPYFLSGGIGPESIDSIVSLLRSTISGVQRQHPAQYCHAIDVNSRFEKQPGLKDIAQLKTFKKLLHEKLSR